MFGRKNYGDLLDRKEIEIGYYLDTPETKKTKIEQEERLRQTLNQYSFTLIDKGKTYVQDNVSGAESFVNENGETYCVPYPRYRFKYKEEKGIVYFFITTPVNMISSEDYKPMLISINEYKEIRKGLHRIGQIIVEEIIGKKNFNQQVFIKFELEKNKVYFTIYFFEHILAIKVPVDLAVDLYLIDKKLSYPLFGNIKEGLENKVKDKKNKKLCKELQKFLDKLE
jgi:hypothetical protein